MTLYLIQNKLLQHVKSRTFRTGTFWKTIVKTPKPDVKPIIIHTKNVRLNKWVNYFQSPTGVRVARKLYATLALSLLLYQTSIMTWAQKYIQMFFQAYASPLKYDPIPPSLGILIQEVISDMELSTSESNKIQVFLGIVDDGFSWGNLQGSTGLLLAFPHIYKHELPSELPDPMTIRYGDKPGDDKPEPHLLRTQIAHDYINSLILSKKSKKFLIARELFRGKTRENNVIEMSFSISFLASVYALPRICTSQIPLFSRYYKIRYGMYGVLTALNTIIFSFLYDSWKSRSEITVDDKASSINQEYLEGGIEYYSGLLKRNKGLRLLIPHRRGEKTYNLNGDHVSQLFRYRIPISKRRDYLVQKMEKINHT